MTALRKRTVSLLLILCITLSLLFALQLSVVGAEDEGAEIEVTATEVENEEGEDVTTIGEDDENAEEGEDEVSPTDIVPVSAISFSDIDGHWGAPYILAAAEKELVRGMGDGTYNPEGKVTRAQFVQMMMNLVGVSAPATAASPFSDVTEDAWYYDVVTNAADMGLIVFAEGEFLPEQAITREEMATLLSKSLQLAKVTGDLTFGLNDAVTDADTIAAPYYEDARFVVSLGIMQGMDDGSFAPTGETTRAQAATVLTRAWDAISDVDENVVLEDDAEDAEEEVFDAKP